MEERLRTLLTAFNEHSFAVSLLNLMDAVDCLMLDLDFASLRKQEAIHTVLQRYKKVKNGLGEVQTEPKSLFKKMKLIGNGHFGEVLLVRHKASQILFAMKSFSKSAVSNDYLWLEHNIMAAAKSPWLVQLCCSFQDESHLYMVMDYMPGGDLYDLIRKGRMSEEIVKFYIAEIVLALEALHSMHYIHGDVKPENVLIDQNGHVKLADFGLSIKTDSKGMVYCTTTGGTLLYVAPEVVELQGRGGWLDTSCDWWSVGVMLYEMLVGETPFNSSSEREVYMKIMNFDNYFKFPSDIKISAEARDIICDFLKDSTVRLGSFDVDSIKQHPFFKTGQWTFDTIHKTVAPIVPKLNNDVNTSNFDCAEDQTDVKLNHKTKSFKGDQRQFVGFTFFNNDKLLGPCSDLLEQQNHRAAKKTFTKSKKKQQKIDLKEVFDAQGYMNLTNKDKSFEGNLAQFVGFTYFNNDKLLGPCSKLSEQQNNKAVRRTFTKLKIRQQKPDLKEVFEGSESSRESTTEEDTAVTLMMPELKNSIKTIHFNCPEDQSNMNINPKAESLKGSQLQFDGAIYFNDDKLRGPCNDLSEQPNNGVAKRDFKKAINKHIGPKEKGASVSHQKNKSKKMFHFFDWLKKKLY